MLRSVEEREWGIRRFAFVTALVLSVGVIATGSAGSATEKSAFLVFVEPTLTAASNGLTLETVLEGGTFNVADRSASGEGEFVLFAGSTEIDSDWTVLAVGEEVDGRVVVSVYPAPAGGGWPGPLADIELHPPAA
jgi:hypothetical protein